MLRNLENMPVMPVMTWAANGRAMPRPLGIQLSCDLECELEVKRGKSVAAYHGALKRLHDTLVTQELRRNRKSL